jgi:hypothetical protein
MRKGSRRGESKFEGLLQQKTTEDHEVVTIAVLGLHDGSGAKDGGVHKMRVIRLAEVIVRVI